MKLLDSLWFTVRLSFFVLVAWFGMLIGPMFWILWGHAAASSKGESMRGISLNLFLFCTISIGVLFLIRRALKADVFRLRLCIEASQAEKLRLIRALEGICYEDLCLEPGEEVARPHLSDAQSVQFAVQYMARQCWAAEESLKGIREHFALDSQPYRNAIQELNNQRDRYEGRVQPFVEQGRWAKKKSWREDLPADVLGTVE